MNAELLNKLQQANEVIIGSETHFKKSKQLKTKAKNTDTAGVSACLIAMLFFIAALTYYSRHLGSIIMPIIFALLTIALILVGIMLFRKSKNIMLEANAEEGVAINIMTEGEEKLSIIPPDYRYPIASSYILKMVSSDRADEMREALSLYDEQLHRWKIENTQSAMLAEQMRQTETLKSINKRSGVSAAASVINLFK